MNGNTIHDRPGQVDPLAGVPNGMTKVGRLGRDLTFSDVLRLRLEEQSGVKFSAHTLERLRERGISLGNGQLDRLADGVDRAGEKGAVDSLVLMDDMAFIVSVKNRTVVTAMTGDSLRENVFTNIDSTVIV